MKQATWFERKFNFEQTVNTFPGVLERLAGTALRLEHKVKDLSENVLTKSLDETWTIKENIGHLTDLESLWQERLDDILTNKVELRTADLTNNKTYLANHNKTSIENLLHDFAELRQKTLAILQCLEVEDMHKSALHPRLRIPMRTIDLFLFVAEHDDHHLARITEVIKIESTTIKNQL